MEWDTIFGQGRSSGGNAASEIFLISCIPDFPINRTWGCRQCDAAFFKDTPRNKAALGGLVPWQWAKD